MGNMSHGGRRKETLTSAPSALAWRRGRQAVKSWSVHKRYQAGDLIAFLSEDGKEIEVMELLMHVYQAPSTDSFSNFKFPLIGVAIFLVLGYQYMKNKGGGKGGKGKFDNIDFSALKGRKKGGLGGLGKGGLGGRRGGLGGLKR